MKGVKQNQCKMDELQAEIQTNLNNNNKKNATRGISEIKPNQTYIEHEHVRG